MISLNFGQIHFQYYTKLNGTKLIKNMRIQKISLNYLKTIRVDSELLADFVPINFKGFRICSYENRVWLFRETYDGPEDLN